jgi:hypothetical protein
MTPAILNTTPVADRWLHRQMQMFEDLALCEKSQTLACLYYFDAAQ